MSGPLGDFPAQPRRMVKANTQGETRSWEVEVPIGASGATGTLAGPYPNGFAIAKNNTGIYDITGMPVLAAGKGRLWVFYYSPALTITHACLTALDFTAGTATLKTLKNDVAAEPASGDKIWIAFSGEIA